MELSNDQIKELKKTEIEILIEFIRVCEAIGVNYYTVEGTLLGTVRHKGFIPWDDDIDVAMFRNDYEKFKKKAPLYFSDDYFLQCYDTDSNVPFSFMKIRKNNTIFVESALKNYSINHGVFIDVFPLDYYPSNKFKQLYINLINNIFEKRTNIELGVSNNKGIIKKIEELVLLIIFPNYRTAIKKKDLFYKRISQHKSILVRNFSSAYGMKSVIPVKYYGKGKSLEFEGLEVNVPVNYKGVLKRVYGDYLVLPPEELRHPHHFVEKFKI